MAKMRGIKPDIWTDEKFVSVSPLARLLFIGMWNHACDNGHVDSSEMQLKMRVLPMDNCDIGELVSELVGVGLVVRQPRCLKVPNIPVHQKIDRRYLLLCDHCAPDVTSVFTDSDRADRSGKPVTTSSGARRAPRVDPLGARDEVKGSEVKGSEGEGEEKEVKDTSTPSADTDAEFDQFWSLYPRKDGKKKARERFIAARKRAELETILEGVRRYCRALPADKSKIKMAEGWLSGDRWEDPEPVRLQAVPDRPAIRDAEAWGF